MPYVISGETLDTTRRVYAASGAHEPNAINSHVIIQFTLSVHISAVVIFAVNLQMHMNPLMISAGNVIRRGYV